MKKIFQDYAHTYKLLDFNRSHSELIFRSRVNKVNTDIIFKSVRGIFCQTDLIGIEIILVPDLQSVPKNFHCINDYGYRVYLLRTSKGEEFYINGGVFGVFENRLDILESPIGDFMWSSENKLILWSEES